MLLKMKQLGHQGSNNYPFWPTYEAWSPTKMEGAKKADQRHNSNQWKHIYIFNPFETMSGRLRRIES